MNPTFKNLGWTVQFDATVKPDEGYQWVVVDADGDENDWFANETDAIEYCKTKSLAQVKEDLWTTITEETDIDDVTLEILQEIARILGIVCP